MTTNAETATQPVLPITLLLDADEALYTHLAGPRSRVIRVSAGDAYRRRGEDRYEIDPRSEGDVSSLFRDLEVRNAVPYHVVHALEETACVPFLARHLLVAAPAPSFVLVARCFAGEPSPEAACLVGLFRTLSVEEPSATFLFLEVDASAAAPDRLAHAVKAELSRGTSDHIRLFGGKRFVRRFERVVPVAHTDAPIRPDGTYLITGGAGGVGRVVARHLVARGARKLVLTGRTPPSERTRAVVAALERSGAETLYLQADVADRSATARAVGTAVDRMGPIHGVLHCAGLIRDGLFVDKTAADYQAVLAPKVRGVTVLDAVTEGQPLDFFVLFSSLAAVLGNPGQGDYAAANAFLDAFATKREGLRAQGLRRGRTVSINWPLWEDGGMTVEARHVERLLRRTGVRALRTDDALRALDTALGGDAVQLIPVVGDVDTIDRTLNGRSRPAEPPAVPPQPAELKGSTTAWLTTLLAKELSLSESELSSDTPLADYGLDSFLALRVLKAMEHVVGKLQSTLLIENSIASLADRLLEGSRDALAAYFGTPEAPASTDPGGRPEPAAEEREIGNVSAAGRLTDSTARWLRHLIAEELQAQESDIQHDVLLSDYGLDSFLALRLLKAMEGVVGKLPSALLTESSIASLTASLLERRGERLAAHFGVDLPDAGLPSVSSAELDHRPSASVVPAAAERAPAPAIYEARALHNDEETRALVDELMRAHGGLSFSISVRDIAPLVFMGSQRDGIFFFHQDGDRLLAATSACPPHAFPTLCRELIDFGRKECLDVNILSETRLTTCDDVSLTATPFAVVQRLPDLATFTMRGNRMRRLRYMVSRFRKLGPCSTEEYRPGSDPETDAKIAEVIDAWCGLKAKANPCIHRVRREILEDRLPADHRVFLTRLDGRLQNVIVLTDLPNEDGYLMDLEFYGPDMPLGGLEFAITQIIEVLRSEGRGLSMGITFGVWEGTSPNADPNAVAILDDLRRNGIYDGGGNHQFKNKFGTVNTDLYLCKPEGADASGVSDVLMMLADPKPLPSEERGGAPADRPPELTSPSPPRPEVRAAASQEPTPGGDARRADTTAVGQEERRLEALRAHGYNANKVPPAHVDFDLLTDSWAELESVRIAETMDALRARMPDAGDLSIALRDVFPFRHLIPVASGRMAEGYLSRCLSNGGHVVAENLLFPTWILHQLELGLEPHELPVAEALDRESDHPFRGNLDCARLESRIAASPGSLAFACVELANNAVGGQPVSLENLRRVKSILSPHGIPLVIDATRVLENAVLIADREPTERGRDIWDIVRDICASADAVTASLTKDFSVDAGGVIATDRDDLAVELQRIVATAGSGLGRSARAILALALADRERNAMLVRRRMRHVKELALALKRVGVPIVETVGGHCVLIRVAEMAAFAGLADPLPTFVAWLLARAGIRAGAHTAGMKRNSWLQQTARLAVPTGLSNADVEEIISRLVDAFRRPGPIVPLRRVSNDAAFLAKAYADFAPLEDTQGARELPRELRPDVPPVAEGGNEPEPLRSTLVSRGAVVETKLVRSLDELQQAFAVRAVGYMGENNEPYDQEFDRNDFTGSHLLALFGGQPVGAMRLRYFADFAKPEQLAVLPGAPRMEVVAALSKLTMGLCRKKGYRLLYAHSESRFVELWQYFGFVKMESPAFVYSIHEYFELRRDLEPHQAPLTDAEGALFLARPEGAWSRPGRLEGRLVSLGSGNGALSALVDAIAANGEARWDGNARSDGSLSLEVTVVRDLDGLQQAFGARLLATCDYAQTFDGSDFSGTHILAREAGEPVGSLRVRYFAGLAWLDCLAVTPRAHALRVAEALVEYATELCRIKGYTRLRAFGCGSHYGAWKASGWVCREVFESRASGERFVDVSCELPPHPARLTLNSSPVLLVRPEGEWSKPGVLEKGKSVVGTQRHADWSAPRPQSPRGSR